MNHCKISILLAVFICVWLSDLVKAENGLTGGQEDMFVEPFLAHMGVPDLPEKGTIRLTGMQTRVEGGATDSDLAVHIEAGLIKDWGLHIRSDGVVHEEFTEVMLQYAFLADKELRSGLSVFGELEIPTGPVPTNEYRGVFGISGRLTLAGRVKWDTTIHYDSIAKMSDYETAFVFRATPKYYPVLEVRGQVGENLVNETYVLPGFKFRVTERIALGAGIQAALTGQRRYDDQALLTYDMEF